MVKVTLDGVVLADSDATIVVEGNHYFPPDAVKREYFKDSSNHTFCPWKGNASYYTVTVNGKEFTDGAWYYPEPSSPVTNIKDYVAFYKNKFQIA